MQLALSMYQYVFNDYYFVHTAPLLIVQFTSWMIPYTCSTPLLNYSLLHLSRMVRLASCGRGGDNPPPPEYMAGMIHQFDVEWPVQEGVMAQFPN